MSLEHFGDAGGGRPEVRAASCLAQGPRRPIPSEGFCIAVIPAGGGAADSGTDKVRQSLSELQSLAVMSVLLQGL